MEHTSTPTIVHFQPGNLSSGIDKAVHPLANMTLLNSTLPGPSTTEEQVLDWQSISAILFVIVIMCGCTRSRVPPPEMRRGHIYRQQFEALRQSRQRREKWKDPARRQAAMDKALYKRQIKSSDPVTGHLMLGEPDDFDVDVPEDEDLEMGVDDYEDDPDESACAICLEPFRVGDMVSMSRKLAMPIQEGDEERPQCPHVFHSECIENWMHNQHDDCPSCRIVLLETKKEKPALETLDETVLVEDEDDYSDEDSEDEEAPMLSTNAAFVIMNGVISRVRRASSSLICIPSQVFNFDPSNSHFDDDVAEDEPLGVSSAHVAIPPPDSLRRVLSLGRGTQSDKLSHAAAMSALGQIHVPSALPLRRVLSLDLASQPDSGRPASPQSGFSMAGISHLVSPFRNSLRRRSGRATSVGVARKELERSGIPRPNSSASLNAGATILAGRISPLPRGSFHRGSHHTTSPIPIPRPRTPRRVLSSPGHVTVTPPPADFTDFVVEQQHQQLEALRHDTAATSLASIPQLQSSESNDDSHSESSNLLQQSRISSNRMAAAFSRFRLGGSSAEHQHTYQQVEDGSSSEIEGLDFVDDGNADDEKDSILSGSFV